MHVHHLELNMATHRKSGYKHLGSTAKRTVVTPFVSKLIIFYSQNTDSRTPFIITMILKSCLAKQNNTKVGIGGYVFDAVSTFKQLLVLLIHGNIIITLISTTLNLSLSS